MSPLNFLQCALWTSYSLGTAISWFVLGSFPHCNSGHNDVSNVCCGLHTRWEMRFHGLCPDRSPIVILVARMSRMCAADFILVGKCASMVCARLFPHYNSGHKDVSDVRCGLHTRWEMRFHGLCPDRSPIVILVARMSRMCAADFILVGKCDSMVCARSVPPL